MVAFSKDHHLGLLFCWKIKEGLKRNVQLYRIKKYVNYFWTHHLQEHFREEERLLFNRVEDKLCTQAKADHQILINRLNGINYYETEEVGEYGVFAELLIKHIRFEEREVFPHLETLLPLALLNEVSEFFDQQPPNQFKDNYPDEFWAEKNKIE